MATDTIQRQGEPVPQWVWDERVNRYRNVATGQFMSEATILEYVERSTQAATAVADSLAGLVTSGALPADAWAAAMWEEIKQEHIRQYLLGIGGINNMNPSHWGRVGAILRDQHKYFAGFLDEIRAGTLSETTIAMRSRMYLNAAREAYERANAIVQGKRGMEEESWVLGVAEHCEDCVAYSDEGWKPIGYFPYPGDGSTACHCILSNSPVLTQHGYVPLLDVRVGDMVWTHRGRWRPVTGLIIKPSAPHHRAACINGVWVTQDHLWFGPDGWVSACDIDNCGIPVYTMDWRGEYRNAMLSMWQATQKARQPHHMYHVLSDELGMCLWETQRWASQDVPVLYFFNPSTATVERETYSYSGGYQGRWRATANSAKECRTEEVASQGRWPILELVLARGQQSKANDLPLSVDVDYGEWSDPGWLRNTSQESRLLRRPPGQSGVDGRRQACPSAWFSTAELTHHLDMSDVRQAIPEIQARRQRPKVLLTEMLLGVSTAVFDLIVADDHSFLIGNLFAHNTNCACHKEYRKVPAGE